MDKMFCTYFLFFFPERRQPSSAGEVQPRELAVCTTPGLPGPHRPGTNTLFLGQELALDGNLLSVPLCLCHQAERRELFLCLFL